MPRMEGKLPVYLGSDPFGSSALEPPIAVADVNGEGDITIVIKNDVLRGNLKQYIETGQIRGLALNIAYMAPAAKKDGE